MSERYPASGEFLLVNNNNSRTKFALANRDTILEDAHRVIDTPDVSSKSVAELLDGWGFKGVVIASVVPEKAEVLHRFFIATEAPVILVSHEIGLGVDVDFPDPSSVGADRLANAAAVIGIFEEAPAIVVDFGTAVTFDIIATGPAYIGGVIAPGLDAMRDYLHDRTALLPKIDLREPPAAIGKSTVDAMLSGAVHGYRGMVREILLQITRELKETRPDLSPKVIATGGYADLIAAGLPEIEEVNPHLTLEGLRIIGNLNFES